MSLYQDSHERVWMQCWRDTTDGVGSMVRAIENTSEGRTTHNDMLQPSRLEGQGTMESLHTVCSPILGEPTIDKNVT